LQFDIFHSVGRIDSITPRLDDCQVMQQFLTQATEAEAMGFDTMWVAESHFSSEVQKSNKNPVIPNYSGEVGINTDAMQLAQYVFAKTKKLNFGTAIHNIVGGNGGPIASADRVRMAAFMNGMRDDPRHLYIGVAAGRFPYINAPFGIRPRDEADRLIWPQIQRLIFLEALEIFLRLSLGETLSSEQLRAPDIDEKMFRDRADWEFICWQLKVDPNHAIPYRRFWNFEPLKLVPDLTPDAAKYLHFVLGSSDPWARDVGFAITDMDVFNLSFTPPEQLDKIHLEMTQVCSKGRKPWIRARLPRTVLVFIDQDPKLAQQRAEKCFDTYIEAMRGTVGTPPKETLLARALIGNPEMICEQLSPQNARRFHADDRLMLWFEFNQSDNTEIVRQMKLFAEQVTPHYSK